MVRLAIREKKDSGTLTSLPKVQKPTQSSCVWNGHEDRIIHSRDTSMDFLLVPVHVGRLVGIGDSGLLISGGSLQDLTVLLSFGPEDNQLLSVVMTKMALCWLDLIQAVVTCFTILCSLSITISEKTDKLINTAVQIRRDVISFIPTDLPITVQTTIHLEDVSNRSTRVLLNLVHNHFTHLQIIHTQSTRTHKKNCYRSILTFCFTSIHTPIHMHTCKQYTPHTSTHMHIYLHVHTYSFHFW